MKFHRWFIPFILLMVIGCQPSSTPDIPPSATPTRELAQITPKVTSVPDVYAAVREYLDAWKSDDYSAMYGMLTSISRDAITEEELTRQYQDIKIESTLSGIDYEILQSYKEPDTAQVSYRITLHSALFGDIAGDTIMNLSLENGAWRVQWADTLVLPQLAGGNYLKRDLVVPARANIYDSSGRALVAQADATSVGVYPDLINPDTASSLYSVLSRLTGLRADTIQQRVESAPEGAGWYVELGEVPSEQINKVYSSLDYSGLVLNQANWRFYYDGGVAPHLIGYVGPIQAEEVEHYRQLGYQQDERVGRLGLEAWGEDYLGGQRGGALYVYNAQGQPVTRLAETPVEPGEAIYTTIDRDLQLALQKTMDGFRGAIVVLERDTGRIRALVSSPEFDPNAYEPANLNFDTQLNEIYNNPSSPWLNRATQEHYPLGSVFKIITMAAAIESGVYTKDSTYECGYFFDELGGGIRLNDWTYDHYLEDGRTQPSGTLTLSQGLIRSCNPWFWHIGLDLFDRGMITTISDMARGFGLGQKTGIEVVEESAGQVPDPKERLDATNLAIGQGDFLTTPLQVADFVAAVGNGGTLYVPQAIEKIVPPVGDPTFVFEPKERSKLPVKPETLAAIQQAMIGVVESTKPRGTANHVFAGLGIPVAGKTGTAETGYNEPHAWFAGYTIANNPDRPDIAIAVFVENQGEGSEYAAPIFRRVVELYFRGTPGRIFPWESTYYVTRTPTPLWTETATPGPDTETPAPEPATETLAPQETQAVPPPTEGTGGG